MFNRLLPRHIDNTYHGDKLALWLFALLVLMKVAMSLNSILNGHSVAKSDLMRLAQTDPSDTSVSANEPNLRGELSVPRKTILEIPIAEQEQMLAQLRAARYGHLLALHVLLLCAARWTPTEIAAALLRLRIERLSPRC